MKTRVKVFGLLGSDCQSCEQWTGLYYILLLVLFSFSHFILSFLFSFYILDLDRRTSMTSHVIVT